MSPYIASLGRPANLCRRHSDCGQTSFAQQARARFVGRKVSGVRRFYMYPVMKVLLLAIWFATLSVVAHAAEPFLGVFSNEAEGFYLKTLMLYSNGKGFYFAAVAGAPVLWKRNEAANEFTLTGPLGTNQTTESFIVRFDTTKREFIILDPRRAEGSRPLHHVSDEIPQRIRDAIKNFGGTIKAE